MSTTTKAESFPSLDALQDAHIELVKGADPDVLTPEVANAIADLIRKAVQTGKVLDNPDDRAAAQGLINFWTARLGAASRPAWRRKASTLPAAAVPLLPAEETRLEAWVPATVQKAADDADHWLATDPGREGEALVRRILLRLLRLRNNDTFEAVPATDALFEDLDEQANVDAVLAKLAQLGVVRIRPDSSGRREITLRSLDLIDHWPLLHQWAEQRRRFRHIAADWAQTRERKAREATDQPFRRRAEKALRTAVLRTGALIEEYRRAALRLFNVPEAPEERLSDDEYKEAEFYRDRSAAELKFVYEKRQLDREKNERRQLRAAAAVAAAVVFALLCAWAIWGWVAESLARKDAENKQLEADKQRGRAERAEHDARLLTASCQVEHGTQLERDDWDAGGAFLWYERAWANFAASAQAIESPEDRERLRTSYSLQLGAAWEQLPFLSGMAYHRNVLAFARTPDASLLLTVGPPEGGYGRSPAVRLWRWTGAAESAGWEPSLLPWGEIPSQEPFAQAQAYLSPNGRFAFVTGAPLGAELAAYVWRIPENGPGEFLGKLKGFAGDLIAAGFSPSGQFFAAVTQVPDARDLSVAGATAAGLLGLPLGQGPLLAASALFPGRVRTRSRVTLWQAERWDAAKVLKVPEEITALDQLAFSPDPSSGRLAVAVGPARDDPGKDLPVCLEWSLRDSPGEAVPRHYNVGQTDGGAPAGTPANFQTFVTYKPDGQVLLVSRSTGKNPRAQVWLFDSKEDTTVAEAPPPFDSLLSGPVSDAAFSPWDDRLVIASEDGTAVMWAPPPLRPSPPNTPPPVRHYAPVRTFRHQAQVFKAEFSPDGQYLVTVSRDYRALVWNADTGQLVHPALHHSGSVTDVGFAEGGRHVITMSRDAFYRWDLARAESQPFPRSSLQTVRTIAADPSANLVVTAGQMRTRAEPQGVAGWARVWDPRTGDPRSPELPHPAPVHHASISGHGPGLVCTVTTEGEVRLWQVKSGRQLWSGKPADGVVVSTALGCADGVGHVLALSRDNSWTYSGNSRLRVYSFDLGKKQVLGVRAFCHGVPFAAAAFSPDCKRVVAYTGDVAGRPGEAVVWDLETEKATVLRGSGKMGTAHDDAITHVAFARSGERLLTSGRDDRAFVWDLRNGSYQELPTQPDQDIGHTGDVEFASFNEDGTRVVTAGADGWAIVWQLEPGAPKGRQLLKVNNRRALTHAVFGTDERYVVTADQDGTVRFWDVQDGRPLATRYHRGQILQLACRPDEEGFPSVYLLGTQTRTPVAPSRGGRSPAGTGVAPLVWTAWAVATQWRLAVTASPGEGKRRVAERTTSRHLVPTGDHMLLTSLAQDEVYEQVRNDRGQRTPGDSRFPARGFNRWHEREATLCELTGRWRAALDHWQRATGTPSAENRWHALWARLARVYAELGEWKSAEDALTKALAGPLPPDEPWWKAELGRARAEARSRQGKARAPDAIADCLEVLKDNPEDDLALFRLAGAYMEAGQFSEAVSVYDKAEKRNPRTPELFLHRAESFMRLPEPPLDRAYHGFLTAGRLFKAGRRTDEADGAYHAAIKLMGKNGVEASRPEQAKVYAELAEVQMARGKFGEASKSFKMATDLDKEVGAYWNGLARALERLPEPRWKEAREPYDKALKYLPDDLVLAASRAEFLIRLQDWDKAAEAYEALVERDCRNLSYRTRLAAIYLQSATSDQKARPKQYEQALRCLEAVVTDFPDDSVAWVRLAAAQVAAGKVEEYDLTRQRLLAVFKTPSGADANNVAWACAFAEGKSPETRRAVELAEKAVSVSPKNADYVNTYGAVLYRAGEYKKALEQLESAEKVHAQSSASTDHTALARALDLVFIAMARYRLDQKEAARQSLHNLDSLIDRAKRAPNAAATWADLNQFWDWLELDVLRREARGLIIP
jgi:WD40 repeat protein/tetratricopeptide (TPR) repeat protein